MNLGCVLFAATASILAARETVLPAQRVAHMMVLRQVYLNGKGPFRMMVDTGASSCALSEAAARRLNAAPAYAVEQVTASGTAKTPALVVDVQAGDLVDARVEVLVSGIGMAGVDGVLGQSWLGRHDYLLDFRRSRLVLDAEAPDGGVRLPLQLEADRPRIPAKVNGEWQDLVIDSGASALVLFRKRGDGPRSSVVTAIGTADVVTGTAVVQLGRQCLRRMASAELDAPRAAGLLPASEFGSVYVSRQSHIAVVVPR